MSSIKIKAIRIVVVFCAMIMIGLTLQRCGTFQSNKNEKSILDVIDDIKCDFPGQVKLKHIENFSIVSTCSDEEISDLINIFEWIKNQCQTLTGKDQIASRQNITVFYLRTKNEYCKYYEHLTGATPSSLAGEFLYDRNALFGSLDVGNGSIAHELVHVFVLQDWPNWQSTLPGWLNESLAVTIGCPYIGFALDDKYVSDIHLYCAKASIDEDKWMSVDSMFQQIQAAYDYPQTRLEASGKEDLSVSYLTTAYMFTRWLARAGLLPQFYQNYRDTQNYSSALMSIGYNRASEAEAPLRSWILSHAEKSYIFGKNEKIQVNPVSKLTDIRIHD